MIKIRIDVDYPYVSRVKSFLYVVLRIKSTKGSGYLKNSRIIAQMINESSELVRVYWFFTPYTIPDRGLLSLLNSDKHEVALHVANRPVEEWKTLEAKTNRKVQYYTIHGTQRIFAQILWGRKFKQTQAIIPKEFPLQSLHDFSTLSFDMLRYQLGYDQTVKETEQWIEKGFVLSMHPEWLFSATQKTKRGPFYDALRAMLKVDQDIETLSTRKTATIKIGRDYREYYKNIQLTDGLVSKLKLRDMDIFTFIERKWCCSIIKPAGEWIETKDNIALLEIKDYSTWWNSIGKKTRNMVRKAEKDNIKVSIVSPSDKLAEGIWKIYNETPIRQGRAFPHYGESQETVAANMYAEKNSTYIGAYIGEELAGFIQILHGDNIAILSNILSMQIHWDKSVNNALIAKAVEVCAEQNEHWLMYGRMGNHPSLDRFKENNGFVKFPITRYYIPLTAKGKLATKLGLHQELKDSLPDAIKYPLLPAVNWISRTKIKIKHTLKKHHG